MSLRGRIARCAALGSVLAACLPVAPAAASGPDAFSGALPLTSSVTNDNFSTSIEDPEALTPNDQGGFGCLPNGTTAANQGEIMGATVWYTVTGNNRILTVTTRDAHTDFDTMLAAYDTTLKACNNDYRPGVSTRSEIRFQSVAGHTYHIQLGSRCPTRACPTPIPAGNYTLQLFSAPDNDTRAAAAPLAKNNTVPYSNEGATESQGEPLTCTVNGVSRAYAKTVWFRYHAPANGIATFTSGSSTARPTDTVMAVYHANDADYTACNDDLNNQIGPSLVRVEVVAGDDYYVQIGGYNPNPSLTVPTAAEQGSFLPDVDLEIGLDHDHDTFNRPPEGGDCDDGNAAINPAAAEVPNNAVDENCDGVAAQDADHDTYLAPPAGPDCNDANAGVHPGAHEIPYDGINQDCDSGADDNDADGDHFPKGPDCNDNNAAVHPGVREVRGNFVDENCDGKTALGALDPDPQFSMPNLAFADGALITSPLVVSDVKRGYRITVRCHGRGCPFRAQTKTAKNRKPVRFAALVHHKLRPGATVSVYVSRPHTNIRGRYARWTVRAGHQTRRVTACLKPTKFKKVIRCG